VVVHPAQDAVERALEVGAAVRLEIAGPAVLGLSHAWILHRFKPADQQPRVSFLMPALVWGAPPGIEELDVGATVDQLEVHNATRLLVQQRGSVEATVDHDAIVLGHEAGPVQPSIPVWPGLDEALQGRPGGPAM
jgi:hypothetical protein